MFGKRRVYIISILVSFFISYIGFFTYDNLIKINYENTKLKNKEQELISLDKTLKDEELNLNQTDKNNVDKKAEIDKKQLAIIEEESTLKQKEDDLIKKEEDLKVRKDNIDLKMIQLANANSGKIAYLTFDDGPSDNTAKVLDILEKYKITATFFVNGHENYADTYKRIVDKGNKIGNHTFSHVYGQVYTSVSAFNDDVDKLNNYLASLGINKPNILRFPGGSNNTSSVPYGGVGFMNTLVKEEINKGYDYFDWNVSSGDAAKTTVEKDVIVNNVINGCSNKNSVIILFHDSQSKTTTPEALPQIVEYLISQGYAFKTLEPGVMNVKFIK